MLSRPMSFPPTEVPNNPRVIAVLRIADVVADWPDAAVIEPDIRDMNARDVRLARAIYRTTLQRWLTLAHVLDGFLTKPLWKMEPVMQGVLLSGAAQLLFMDRLPVHAVVDESVDIARKLIRPGAAGLANAVLRKVARLVESPVVGKPWTPAADRLPTEDGFVPLTAPVLPAVRPESDDEALRHQALAVHLEAATSHPRELVLQWIQAFGARQATGICQHGIVTPPVVVSVEPGLDFNFHDDLLEPHKQDGFAVWKGWHNDLPNFLVTNRARRVQDPASAQAVQTTANLSPKVILDYCAGRGTKSRQLAHLHPEAKVIASDTSAQRLLDFDRIVKTYPNIRIAPPHEIGKHLNIGGGNGGADLILLDVPCSNTGVLARRPGAKYRYSQASMQSLVHLQRSIIDAALPLLAKPGHLLYSTCSLEEAENHQQTRYILEKTSGQLVSEKQTLPAGAGRTYHDGSYHALIRISS